MDKSTDVLNSVLGIDEQEKTPVEKVLPKVEPIKSNEQDIERDYEYQRQNFYQLV